MLSCEMRKDDNMIKLWEKDVPGYNKNYGNEPDMMPYIIEDGKVHGAVIVVPGGGYVMRAPHEGEPIALWLNKIGLSAFVLNYRVAPYRYPCSYYDAQRAIRIVRCNAKKWNIASDRIGILGFSAGAHLAAIAATYFDDGIKDSTDEIDSFSSRPDALVLCYPVITFGKYSHLGSVIALLGDNPDEKLIKKLSLENAVTKNTPQTFIWHTSDDESVPVQNTLLFSKALKESGIPFETHIFRSGRHGLGLAKDCPDVAIWTKLCENWLRAIKFIY